MNQCTLYLDTADNDRPDDTIRQQTVAVKPPHVQTKREIEAALAEMGIRPRKRFGQHFLIDGNLMRRLVQCADPSPEDVVLEVGLGTGGLTDLLVASGASVVGVEIDRDLCRILSMRYASAGRFTLICGDVLASKHELHGEVARTLAGCESDAGGGVKLVANLPYQVATPLMLNLLVDYPAVRRLCFTVQAEVGQRITAGPGGKSYGPLGIIAQLLCRIEVIARIGPQAFWPRPKVDSVMLRMDVGQCPFARRDELRAFASFVRATFEHRRKTLRAALGYVISDEQRERVCHNFDTTRRPEQLAGPEWLELYRFVHRK